MSNGEITMLNSSAEIGELAGALAEAQAAFATVVKDNTAKVETTKGPGYTYKYADLASCLEAVRGPLSRNGLAVMQTTVPGGPDLMLRTILVHKSGQWIASDFPLISSDWTRPQAVGSVITYARRYALCALLQIATDDDDGAAAQQQAEQRRPAAQPRAAKPGIAPDSNPSQLYPEWLKGYCWGINEKWLAEVANVPSNVKAPAEIISKFQLNRHLLKALQIPAEKSEAANLTAGSRAWQGNHEAMEAEARVYCRKLWKDAKAKLKPSREPGDDDMPSPDEEAALDRIAAAK